MTEPSTVQIETEAGPMPALRWMPPAGAGPGLVLVQEIFGLSDYIRGRGADLAELGYVVLAPEVYWRLDDAEVDESRPDFLEQGMRVASRVDWDSAVRDVRAALTHLRGIDEVTGGVGLVGFCFGGGLAFNVAAAESPDALVSYYGSTLPDLLDLAPMVDMPSLHHFGRDDQFIDGERVARVRDAVCANPRARFEIYDGAGHAFDNPMPAFHHEEASQRAWRTTVDFLAEWLPTSGQ
ncbi:MAG: dienelactone hydrolase family protein, partial [Nocardioidaceae bacterium]